MEKNKLSIAKAIALVFIPTFLATGTYVGIGLVWQGMPSIALFYSMTVLILFPIELAVVMKEAREMYGKYSLQGILQAQSKCKKWEIFIYAFVLFCFAGLMSVTVTPLENLLVSSISNVVNGWTPAYFDWLDMELTRSYPKGILLFTSILFLIMNSFVGPIIEELFFRGYLTTKLERFGWKAPIIVSILFSLYHLWQPFSNLFRTVTFGVVAMITYRKRNIYISMLFHCMCNLLTTVSFLTAWWA